MLFAPWKNPGDARSTAGLGLLPGAKGRRPGQHSRSGQQGPSASREETRWTRHQRSGHGVAAQRLSAWLAAGLATLATAPAGAHGSRPIPENPAWKQYVLGTGKPDAAPVRVVSTSGAHHERAGSRPPVQEADDPHLHHGRPAPTIVLDYGREVGGLRSSTSLGSLRPTVPRRSPCARPYSETLQFLWSYGNSTLSVAAAAGDTNLKLGSVANFVVGVTLEVDDETATIAAVGTQSRSTTLVRRRRGGRHEHQGGVAPPGSLPATRCGSTPPARRSP